MKATLTAMALIAATACTTTAPEVEPSPDPRIASLTEERDHARRTLVACRHVVGVLQEVAGILADAAAGEATSLDIRLATFKLQGAKELTTRCTKEA